MTLRTHCTALLLASVVTLTNVGAQPMAPGSTAYQALLAKMPAHSLVQLQTNHPAAIRAKLPADQAQLRAADNRYPFSTVGGVVMVELLLRLAPGVPASAVITDGTVLVTAGPIVGVRVPTSALPALALDGRVLSMELPSLRRTPTTDRSVAEIRADQVHAGTNGLPPTTGRGVIVGVFDTGLDLTHPDFSTESGTRVLRLWDISDAESTNPPAGLTYGREYTKEQIDADVSAVVQKDLEGHGTHVTGTAAGNGNGNKTLRGVAPDADLIIVKGLRQDNERAGFSELDIIAGCQYIIAQAQAMGKPVVVNLSLGNFIGPHDGSTAYEQALSGMVGPGVVIVAAAGNEGGLAIHAGSTVTESTAPEFMFAPINLCENYPDFCPPIPGLALTLADVWHTTGAVDSLIVTAYSLGLGGLAPVASVPVMIGQSLQSQAVTTEEGTTIGYLDVITSAEPQTNGASNIVIRLSNNTDQTIVLDSYLWSFTFTGAADGRIDLWGGIPLPPVGPIVGAVGTTTIFGDNAMTIGSPATAQGVISVGSYTTKNEWTGLNGPVTEGMQLGAISSFSSRGPTRDGRSAPHISAPGEVIFSAKTSTAASYSGVNNDANTLVGGQYVGIRGTSMAAPHVAGVVALMLQARPNLTAAQVADILAATARNDDNNPVADNAFGAGKIDALAAVQGAVTSVNDAEVLAGGQRLAPNPVGVSFSYQPRWTQSQVRVIGVDGTRYDVPSRSGANGAVTVETSSLAPGTYLLQEWSLQGVIATPFVRLR